MENDVKVTTPTLLFPCIISLYYSR